MIKKIFLTIFMILISSCIQKKVGNFAEVKNEGVYVEEKEFTVIGGSERGEFKTGDQSVIIKAKLTNKSEYVYQNIKVTLSEIPTSLLKYAERLDGVSEFPGNGGTCRNTLLPGEGCELVFKFDPIIAGSIIQKVRLEYSNLVEKVETEYALNFFVGDSPIILEINSVREHDFGAKERTLPQDIYEKEIVVKNYGGLTARNLQVSMTNLSDGAFKIKEHNCPTNLKAEEECRVIVYFSSPNFLETDQNRIYTANVLIDYIKSTSNSTKIENGKFSYGLKVESTKIEGVLATNGSNGIIFPDLIHGNFATSTFQLKNIGPKELILRDINVYNTLGDKVAVCRVESNTHEFICYDPIQTHLVKDDLRTFPFKIKDRSECFYNFGNGNYSRNPVTGDFVGGTVQYVNGAYEGNTGSVCDVTLEFHASYNQTINTSYGGWSLGFTYDSTLLNAIKLYETTLPDSPGVKVITANTVIRGSLFLKQAQLPGKNANDPPLPYLVDAGRVTALQATSTYVDQVKFVFKNTSLVSPVVIKEIYTDDELGNRFDITNTSSTLNNYYTVMMVNSSCKLNEKIVLENCEVGFRYSPKLPVSDLKNYGLSGMTNRARKFHLVYNDGCSVLEDGTPCPDKIINFEYKNEVITRGSLQYNTVLSGANSGGLKLKNDPGALKRNPTGNLMAGERGWYHLWITNIGSGPVKYLRLTAENNLKLSASGILPFYIIPSTDGLTGTQKDCSEFLRGTPAGDILAANVSTIPVDFPAGESCRLTIETQLRSNEVGILTNAELWLSANYFNDPGYLEKYVISPLTRNISFEFFDGDTTLPVAQRSNKFLDNLGEPKIIAGGAAGVWQLKTAFDYYGRLVPITPSPATGTILFKPALYLNPITQDPKSQYANSRAGINISAHVYNGLLAFADNSFPVNPANSTVTFPSTIVTGLPSVAGKEIFTYLNSTSDLNHQLKFSDYVTETIDADYVFYAGAYPVSSEKIGFSFNLRNTAAQGAALVTSVVENLACINSPSSCTGASQITKTTSLPSSVFPNETSIVMLELEAFDASAIGRYESIYSVTMNTPIPRSIKIKIVADVIAETVKRVKVSTVDYSCISNDNGATCSTLTETQPETDVSSYFKYSGNGIDSFYMRGVIASPMIHKKKFIIENTGTTPIYDFKLYLKMSANISILSYDNGTGGVISPKPLDYSAAFAANQYQCQTTGNAIKGILNVGDRCEIFINFRALSSATMEQSLTYSYKVLGADNANDRNGVYLSKSAKIIFSSTNQANLVVLGNESEYKQLNYNGETVFSYPIKFKKYIQSNHPVLNSYPTTVFDSSQLVTEPVVQLLNQRSEKASLLKQYEKYMLSLGNPSPPAPSGAWTTIFKNTTIGVEVQGGVGCFYGADKNNATVPADAKGFNDNSVVLNTGCLLRVLMDADLKKIGELKPQSSVIELEYYSSLRIVTKKMYIHLEGFVEPFRSTTDDPTIKDVIATDDGTVSFSWKPFLDEEVYRGGSNLDAIKNYRVFYAKTANDLLKIYDTSYPSTLHYIDTAGVTPSIFIDNLSLGTVYYFRVTAIREINFGGDNIEYLSVGDGFLRNKIIIPEEGFAFNFDNKVVFEKSARPYSGNATKAQAVDTCSSENIRVLDEAQLVSLQSKLITNNVYEIINLEEAIASSSSESVLDLIYSDHNFTTVGTWVNEVQDIGLVFNSAYNCSIASAFYNNDSVGYIKICDNNSPENQCCNVNVLNQIRGRPLSNKIELKNFYTNVGNLTAKFRCFADFSNYLQ